MENNYPPGTTAADIDAHFAADETCTGGCELQTEFACRKCDKPLCEDCVCGCAS